MNGTKSNKIKINRKGIVENFLALLFVFIGIAVIFGVLYIFMYAKMKASDLTIASDLNINEGLYTTRILLNQEIRPDYKVYDAVINAVNEEGINGNSNIGTELYSAIKMFYPKGLVTDKWLIIINNKCFVISNTGVTSSETNVQTATVSSSALGAQSLTEYKINECASSIIDKMPKVTVPNPNGENILVLFKPSSYLDGQTSRIFGYRADQLKGISNVEIPEYSADGRKLEKIENIPNIECSSADSAFGRICAADEALVNQLRILSAEKLQKENMKLVITQAYRTYDIQKNLYLDACAKDSCDLACNPDVSSGCPHMQAGAVDIILYDSSGNQLNGKDGSNPQLVIDIMCEYGFVNWNKENWHFEYGTNQWDAAVEKRANGEKACTY